MSKERWGENTNAWEENRRFQSLGRQKKTYERPHCVHTCLLGTVSYRSQALNIYFHPIGASVGMQDAQRDRVRSPPKSNPTGKPLGLHLGQTKYSNIALKLSAYSGPLEMLVIRKYQCHVPLSQLLNVNRYQDSSKKVHYRFRQNNKS